MTDPSSLHNFLPVARADEIAPGSEKDVRVFGRVVRIRRDEAGDLSAVDLVCRHQNMSLAGGDIESTPEGDVVTCAAHGWRYNLDTGACLNEPWAALRRREVKVVGGRILLSLRSA